MIKRSAAFTWGKISRKQLQLLTWWREGSPHRDKEIVIFDGAIRSGKTVVGSFSYVEWAMTTFQNGEFALCGKTIKSLRRNVVGPLKKVLAGRGYTVKDNKSDNELRISKGGNECLFYLFGGKDEASQDLIQGVTLCGIFFDEMALQPESFVSQGIARCSVEGSKIWGNCNPSGPYHYIKTELIDKAEEKNVLHIHFEIEDNLTLSKKIIERYKRMYSGVFYKRFILGLWVAAEGIIYDMFDELLHVVKEVPKHRKKAVSIDYGTQNPTAFGMFTWTTVEDVCKTKEYHYSGRDTNRQKTDSEYAADLIVFVDGELSTKIYVDPSAASFKAELRKQGFTNVRNAKNDKLDGIRFVSTMLTTEKFTTHESCKETIKERGSYLWCPKAQQRGEDDPIKEYDHHMDVDRYFLFSEFGKLGTGGSREFRV